MRSSLDGFTENLPASINPPNPNLSVQAQNVFFWNTDGVTTAQPGSAINLIGPIHSDLNSPVTFRFYAWNAEGNLGTFSIDNVTISGTATPLTNAVYTWNKTGSANWSDSTNWDPARTYPDPTDILVFSGNITTTATNVPTQTLARLVVEGSARVTLEPTGPGINPGSGLPSNTLTLQSANAPALSVQPGSSLTLNSTQSNTSLAISLPSGARAFLYGTVAFTSSIGTSGINHRLLATDQNAILFFGGAVFNAIRFNGNPFGNTGTVNTTRFESGSVYNSRGGANPFGLSAPDTKVVFEIGSLFRQQQTRSIALVGRSYGNFEVNLLDSIAQQNINVGTGGALPMQAENINVVVGNLNFPLNVNNSPLNIHLSGNLNVADGATFNYSPTAAQAQSTLSFMGGRGQVISGGGNLMFGGNSVLQVNTSSLILSRPVSLDGVLNLVNGIVLTSFSFPLTLSPSASVLGGGPTSFVNGPLTRGTAATETAILLFPVGSQTYRPITLQVDLFSATPTYITVQQLEGAPPDRNLPVTLDGVSQLRFYRVSADNTLIQQVIATIRYLENDEVNDPVNLRIASSDTEGNWVNRGGEGLPDGEGAVSGTITSTFPDDGTLGDFVLANADGGQNPLPVELISFTATAESGAVALHWSTASELNNRGFEIQRSTTGTEWSKINFMKGYGNSQTQQTYRYTDRTAPAAAVLYYRLKQLDQAGTFAYSKIVAVSPGTLSPGITLYPNPVVDELRLHFPHPAQDVRLRVVNLLGQVVLDKTYTTGERNLSENLSSLPAGTYHLEVWQDQSRTTRKFLKAPR